MNNLKPRNPRIKSMSLYQTKYLSLLVFLITVITTGLGLYTIDKPDDNPIISNTDSSQSPSGIISTPNNTPKNTPIGTPFRNLDSNNNEAGTSTTWKDDPVWYDGKAEYAVYDATRIIYGKIRNYEAVIITNKQKMDTITTTKALDWRTPRNIEVFKINIREVIPTENYDYKFLTTSFIGTTDLKPYKLVMSSQEDCGSTYKQYVIQDDKMLADQYVYFPDAGHIKQQYKIPPNLQFYDSLVIALRNHPSVTQSNIGDNNQSSERTIRLLPDQTDTHKTEFKPQDAMINYIGREDVTLNNGSIISTHHLKVKIDAGGTTQPFTGDFWFAADNGSKWLHILVKYADQQGQSYLLKSNKRWAYWERK